MMSGGGAMRRAMHGLTRDAAIDSDEAGARLGDDQALADDRLVVSVEHDEVGLAEGFAGDNEDLAALHRDVGDRGVAHDDVAGLSSFASEA